MQAKEFLMISLMFSGVYNFFNSAFNLDYTSRSQKINYNKYPKVSRSKGYTQKTFFPAYAKTSKMIGGNRYGRHWSLERRVK